MSKQPLLASWRRGLLDELPPDLRLLFNTLAPATQATCTYDTAMLAPDTPLQHWAHILRINAADKSVVTWTGKGVRPGAVVTVQGPIETIKRQIENYKIASVPAQKPFRCGNKQRKPAQKRIKIERISGPVPLTNISKSRKLLIESA